MIGISTSADADVPSHGVGLGEAWRTWTRIALLSFGGPAGQIAVMHRILVDEKRWISERRFLHALNYCMLLPGPEAQQLATYIGWLMHGTRGGLLAGLLFIAPGIVSIMALSWLYASFGQITLVSALFFGLKAAVLSIVLQALVRVARRALKTPAARAVAIIAFLGIFAAGIPFPAIVLGAGLVGLATSVAGWNVFAPLHHADENADEAPSLLGDAIPPHAHADWPRALRTIALWLVIWLAPLLFVFARYGSDGDFGRIALFFSQVAVVTFGGAYAVLAYVAQEAVQRWHWLSAGEMLDGLGMAETTPGPLIMVLQFVGFMAAFRAPGSMPPLWAGTVGGLLATWVTFAPCFLFVFAGAPWIERLRGIAALDAALAAITAAVVGVILNLTLWFAIHALFASVLKIQAGPFSLDVPVIASIQWPAALLSLCAAIAIFRFGAGVLTTIAACAVAGVLLRLAGLA
jgi:chromate transporter